MRGRELQKKNVKIWRISCETEKRGEVRAASRNKIEVGAFVVDWNNSVQILIQENKYRSCNVVRIVTSDVHRYLGRGDPRQLPLQQTRYWDLCINESASLACWLGRKGGSGVVSILPSSPDYRGFTEVGDVPD